MKEGNSNDVLPSAKTRPRQSGSLWAWAPVLLALVILFWAGYSVYQQRGIQIKIQFQAGHGIKPGDQIKFLGLNVGYVEEAILDVNLDKVWVHARLNSESRSLAKEGTRFWIVRPQVDLSGIEGLDTVIGARYIAALPKDQDKKTEGNQNSLQSGKSEFIGLESAPIRATLPAGGLEIQLRANQRGGLRAGAPLLYRQVPVGALLTVELADDASGVVANAYVLPEYKALIRENTVFWNASGFRIQAGLMDGLSVSLDSIQTLVSGGVALATPNPPKEPARPGTRFMLHAKEEASWTEWRPSIPLSSIPLPDQRPRSIAVKRTWMKDYYLITSKEERVGTVLLTDLGILGPQEFLEDLDPAAATHPVLPDLGVEIKGGGKFIWKRRGVGLWAPVESNWNQIKQQAERSGALWSLKQDPQSNHPANVWLIPHSNGNGETLKPQFVSQSHLTAETGAWIFMAADWSWLQTWSENISSYQGAVAVNAETGHLIGVFIADPNREAAWITLAESLQTQP